MGPWFLECQFFEIDFVVVVETGEEVVEEDAPYWYKLHDYDDGIDVVYFRHDELLRRFITLMVLLILFRRDKPQFCADCEVADP
jgi:hypothetical protein